MRRKKPNGVETNMILSLSNKFLASPPGPLSKGRGGDFTLGKLIRDAKGSRSPSPLGEGAGG